VSEFEAFARIVFAPKVGFYAEFFHQNSPFFHRNNPFSGSNCLRNADFGGFAAISAQ
jgi:hypothetical protein